MRYLMFEPNNSNDWGSWTECNIWGLIEMWIDNFLWQKSNLFFEGCNSTTGRGSTETNVGRTTDAGTFQFRCRFVWKEDTLQYRMVPPSFVGWFIAPSKYSYEMLWDVMSIIHYGYHGDVHQLSQVWDPILYAQFQWISEVPTEGDGGAPGRVGDRHGSPGTRSEFGWENLPWSWWSWGWEWDIINIH